MRGNRRHIILVLTGTLLFAAGLLISCSKKNNPVRVQPPPAGTPNHAPVITSTPPSKITEDSTLSYQIKANDQDGDPLSYGVQNLNGATVSTTGMVTWTAPTVKKDSTIKHVTYWVSDGTDTTRQSADLTVTYVKPQPKPPVLDLTHIYNSDPYNANKSSFNQDELTPSTIDLPDTATNGDKITYTSLTDNNGYFSSANLSGNKINLKSKETNQDEKYSFTLNFKDDKTGLTNSKNLEGIIFNHPTFSGTVSDLANPTPQRGVGQLGYQLVKGSFKKGNWVALNDTLLNSQNGAKIVKDNKGREYFTTDSNNQFEVMAKMRTDSVKKKIGSQGSLAIKVGDGTLGKLTYAQAKDIWGSTPPQGMVGSPYPTKSYALTVDLSPEGAKGKNLKPTGYDKVVGWNSSVGGTMNSTYTPGQFLNFFGTVNATGAGQLVKYDINNVEIVEKSNVDSTFFDKGSMNVLYNGTKIMSDSLSKFGEKPLNIVEDSTAQHFHNGKPDLGWYVIFPAAPGSPALDGGAAATNNQTAWGQGKAAVTWIRNDLYPQWSSSYYSMPDHERFLGVGGALHELQDSSWKGKTEIYWKNNLSAPKGIDMKTLRISHSSYKNGTYLGAFLFGAFNMEDF